MPICAKGSQVIILGDFQAGSWMRSDQLMEFSGGLVPANWLWVNRNFFQPPPKTATGRNPTELKGQALEQAFGQLGLQPFLLLLRVSLISANGLYFSYFLVDPCRVMRQGALWAEPQMMLFKWLREPEALSLIRHLFTETSRDIPF